MPHPEAAILGCTHYPLMEEVFQDALGSGVSVYSQPRLVAESLADYLERRPEFIGKGIESAFFTTGDPQKVGAQASLFMRRPIAFFPAFPPAA